MSTSEANSCYLCCHVDVGVLLGLTVDCESVDRNRAVESGVFLHMCCIADFVNASMFLQRLEMHEIRDTSH